jgi:3-hydroxyisobutyrate dehydrogenase-like beta-hydroxyacid dehydrogenase
MPLPASMPDVAATRCTGDNAGMNDVTVGLLHPGEMGAAVGQCLAGAGHRVLWAAERRSPATRERAEAAGLTASGLADIAARSDVMLSVCPPAAALEVARQVAGAGFGGVYMDANAIAPATAREVAGIARGGGADRAGADLVCDAHAVPAGLSELPLDLHEALTRVSTAIPLRTN